MRRTRETGKAHLSTVIFLLFLAGAGYAGWNVIPVLYDHYELVDRVNEICRTPKHVVRGDPQEEIRRMLMREVSARNMTDWIGPGDFQITTTEHNRRIYLYYERTTNIVPKVSYTFKWEYEAEQPLL